MVGGLYVIKIQLLMLTGVVPDVVERTFLEQQLLADPFPAPPFSPRIDEKHDAKCDFPRLHFEVSTGTVVNHVRLQNCALRTYQPHVPV